MLSNEDKELRRGRITGSVAAACLGFDPFCTPLGAYQRIMQGPTEDRYERGSPLQRGHVIEPALIKWGAEEIARDTGRVVTTDRPGTIAHPDLPWAAVSVDAVYVTRPPEIGERHRTYALDDFRAPDPSTVTIYVGEAKDVGIEHADKWGSEWTQQIPMNVAAQCTWQLLHMPEAIAVIIPVLLGAHHRLSIYTWVRDADLEAKMVHALGAWHHRHIVGKTPPEARPADHGIIASIWEAQEIELGDDPRIAELAMLDADAQKREAAAKRERQGYKVEIGSIMQHATRCSGPWGNVTWKANERVQELDHDRLVAAVDRRLAGAGRVVREAIAECTTDVSSRVLRNNYGKRTPAKKGSPSRRAT